MPNVFGKLSSSIKEDFSREDSISVVHVFLASLVALTTSFSKRVWRAFEVLFPPLFSVLL